jgi:hypothetical protein
MLIAPSHVGVVKLGPPPLWFVTNGEITVGPVITNLLKRGVAAGRVSNDCLVSPGGRPWRPVETVREIAALYRSPSISPTDDLLSEIDPGAFVRDQDEACFHVTRLAKLVTGAESAMLHFRERMSTRFFTRAIIGPMSSALLNEELPTTDLVFAAARRGRPINGPPYGPVEDALALRFASTRSGVGGAAMIPIFLNHRLRALLELARPGHAFRRADLQRAERIAQRALYQHEN